MIKALFLAVACSGGHEQSMDSATAQFGVFRADNERLIAARTPVRAVFMGDSITEGWKGQDRTLFVDGVIDRGVSGQTSAQMLARFQSDVIALRPRIAHIMAGTNDIADNGGPVTLDQIAANIRCMAELARKNEIRVIIASVPAAKAFSWRPGIDPVPAISALNRRLVTYARASGLSFVNYYQALAGPDGGMKPGLASDGVHPTPEGFAVMTPLAKAALSRR